MHALLHTHPLIAVNATCPEVQLSQQPFIGNMHVLMSPLARHANEAWSSDLLGRKHSRPTHRQWILASSIFLCFESVTTLQEDRYPDTV